MNERVQGIQRLLEYCYRNQGYIEPASRNSMNQEHLFDIINTYNPGVIVKAGLGSGALLSAMAGKSAARIVVVEPSMEVVREFLKDHGSDKGVGDVQFVIGEFSDFPIDYYAANLIVCIDNLSFIESSSAIDEFRRALQFDGVLYMASPVLSDDDENAVMDEYLRRMFPLHNEYYMPEELKTVLGLNEFRFIKGSLVKFPESVRDQTAFFSGLYGGHEKDCLEFLEGNSEAVSGFYDYSEGRFSMPYYSGVFMRIKADYVFEKK